MRFIEVLDETGQRHRNLASLWYLPVFQEASYVL